MKGNLEGSPVKNTSLWKLVGFGGGVVYGLLPIVTSVPFSLLVSLLCATLLVLCLIFWRNHNSPHYSLGCKNRNDPPHIDHQYRVSLRTDALQLRPSSSRTRKRCALQRTATANNHRNGPSHHRWDWGLLLPGIDRRRLAAAWSWDDATLLLILLNTRTRFYQSLRRIYWRSWICPPVLLVVSMVNF